MSEKLFNKGNWVTALLSRPLGNMKEVEIIVFKETHEGIVFKENNCYTKEAKQFIFDKFGKSEVKP